MLQNPPHKIMRDWFYYSIWLGFSFPTDRIWKWFVLAVYQFRKGISAGPALKYLTWFIGAGGVRRATHSAECWMHRGLHCVDRSITKALHKCDIPICLHYYSWMQLGWVRISRLFKDSWDSLKTCTCETRFSLWNTIHDFTLLTW